MVTATGPPDPWLRGPVGRPGRAADRRLHRLREQPVRCGEGDRGRSSSSVGLRVPAKAAPGPSRPRPCCDRERCARRARGHRPRRDIELPCRRASLADELAHDADLDIEALYCLHAVANGSAPRPRRPGGCTRTARRARPDRPRHRRAAPRLRRGLCRPDPDDRDDGPRGRRRTGRPLRVRSPRRRRPPGPVGDFMRNADPTDPRSATPTTTTTAARSCASPR